MCTHVKAASRGISCTLRTIMVARSGIMTQMSAVQHQREFFTILAQTFARLTGTAHTQFPDPAAFIDYTKGEAAFLAQRLINEWEPALNELARWYGTEPTA